MAFCPPLLRCDIGTIPGDGLLPVDLTDGIRGTCGAITLESGCDDIGTAADLANILAANFSGGPGFGAALIGQIVRSLTLCPAAGAVPGPWTAGECDATSTAHSRPYGGAAEFCNAIWASC